MLFLNTEKLSAHISELYQRIEKKAKADSVYIPIMAKVIFGDSGFYDDIFYVFSDADGYHCNYVERGEVSRRYETRDLFDISFYVLERCVSSMSWIYAGLNQSNPNQRPAAFNKRIEYMRLIGEKYAQRCKENIEKILETAPYNEDEFI
jgi:hypothetical protein